LAAIQLIPVGILRQYVGGQEALDLEGWAGRLVRDLLADLAIPSPLVGGVLVDGILVQKDYRLRDGDKVKLIPLLGGG